MRVGIVAPSSKVPQVELRLGVEKLQASGFEVKVHPQCRKGHSFFAGNDEDRAEAFFEYSARGDLDVIWSARGGYGAARLLPLLDRMTEKDGVPPKKLLVGYSDCTVLMEYVRTRWGWNTLHAPMPGFRNFTILPKQEWNAILSLVRGEKMEAPWGKQKLKLVGGALTSSIRAPLIGGNLTVWTTLCGTPYAGDPRGKILFFEDVDEGLYRLDRMLMQLRLSGGLEGALALVLGNFQNCDDKVTQVLKPALKGAKLQKALPAPRASDLVPLRPTITAKGGIPKLFGEAVRDLGIPVFSGLPSGHGPDHAPIPLGAVHELSPDGRLRVVSWDYSKS